MVLSGEMIDKAVKNGRMEGKEKRGSTSRKKERETQAVFSKHQPNQGYTPYPVYPQNPSYYPTINNVAPAPYVYPPPRPMAPPVRLYPTYAPPLPQLTYPLKQGMTCDHQGQNLSSTLSLSYTLSCCQICWLMASLHLSICHP